MVIPDLRNLSATLHRRDGWQGVNKAMADLVRHWDDKLPLPQSTRDSCEAYRTIVGDLMKLDAEGELARVISDFPHPEISAGTQIAPHVIVLDYANQKTERYVMEMHTRFFMSQSPQRGHLFLCFWQDEIVSQQDIRIRAREAVFRYYFQFTYGPLRTLADMLRQEGLAQSYGGRPVPDSEAQVEMISRVIQDHLDSEQYRHQFSCIFGDEIAALLDYKPLGLPPYAGLKLALAKARDTGVDPITFHQTSFELSEVS